MSTDFDTSDRLYFEPLTPEDVLHVIERERPLGVIVQFGGQTAINLARPSAKPECASWALPWKRSTWPKTVTNGSAFAQARHSSAEGRTVTSLEEAWAWP